jgi:hypothetical protein
MQKEEREKNKKIIHVRYTNGQQKGTCSTHGESDIKQVKQKNHQIIEKGE